MGIDEILGRFEQRYFGAGHKRAAYYINKQIIWKETDCNGTARIEHTGGSWSEKMGNQQQPHLSTIDGIILATMFAEKYLTEYMSIDSENYFLASFEIRAGVSPIEDLNNIPLNIKKEQKTDNGYCFSIRILGMRIKVKVKKSDYNLKLSKNIDTIHKHFISEHLKNIRHDIRNIAFTEQQGISCVVKRDVIKKSEYYGFESTSACDMSLLEWLVVFSQMGQLLAYEIDEIDRQKSDTLWMQWVKAEMDEPFHYREPVEVSGYVTKSKILKLGNSDWRLFEMEGTAINDLIQFSGKMTHQLPVSEGRGLINA